MNLCDVENKHLVVRDLFANAGLSRVYLYSEITGLPRTVPGDCYCCRCNQAVPFWHNSNGEPFPATFHAR
jgi:hypothetical protein